MAKKSKTTTRLKKSAARKAKQPKKRGRPPKKKTPAAKKPAAKKKKGRPAKKKLGSAKKVAIAEPVKRPRGRPRKIVVVTDGAAAPPNRGRGRPPGKKPASTPAPQVSINHQNGHTPGTNGDAPSSTASNTQARIRELIKLAKEQGYLTFDDLNEALPPELTDPEELDLILMRLRKLEIPMIEASEVDRYKDIKKDSEDEEEEKAEPKMDILDDPVRMYLKQMGQVPLLTREQEVEISKRIEEAEERVASSVSGSSRTLTSSWRRSWSKAANASTA